MLKIDYLLLFYTIHLRFNVDSVDIQGEVTFEKPLSVTDAEGVGLQQLEENGMLLSTENFPPHHSFTFASSVTVSIKTKA